MTTAAVKAALSELDGSPESAISLLAGVPVGQLGEYGGMPDDAPCTCRAYHPDYNHHTDAEHTDCHGGLTSMACGGCDSCINAQAVSYEVRAAAEVKP